MKTAANILNFLFAAILLVFGVIYLVKTSFMPYHSDAVLRDWYEVDQYFQYLILALMRVVSGGFLVSAVSIIFLQIKFNKEKTPWIATLILIIGAIIESTTIYATYLVRTFTPGNPPTYIAYIAIVMLVAGYLLNLKITKP
jgi:hypothetical protein